MIMPDNRSDNYEDSYHESNSGNEFQDGLERVAIDMARILKEMKSNLKVLTETKKKQTGNDYIEEVKRKLNSPPPTPKHTSGKSIKKKKNDDSTPLYKISTMNDNNNINNIRNKVHTVKQIQLVNPTIKNNKSNKTEVRQHDKIVKINTVPQAIKYKKSISNDKHDERNATMKEIKKIIEPKEVESESDRKSKISTNVARRCLSEIPKKNKKFPFTDVKSKTGEDLKIEVVGNKMVQFSPEDDILARIKKIQHMYKEPRASQTKKTDNNNTNLKILQDIVDIAVKERKTFTVSGNYSAVRKALLSRGWIEKIRLSYLSNDKENIRKLYSLTVNELIQGINDKVIGYSCKRVILSKLLGRHQVDLYWDYGSDPFTECPEKHKVTIVNRFRRGIRNYTSKQGLNETVKHACWINKSGKIFLRHPRTYSLTNSGDSKDFIEDFKITAALGLLKWVVEAYIQKKKILSEKGKIPVSAFSFAIDECTKYIKKSRHEDIDFEIEDALDFEWNHFLEYFYKIVHSHNHFKSKNNECEESLYEKAKYVLEKIEPYWPHLEMDGMMNIWILKPIFGSRGIGIHICRTLQYILQVIRNHENVRYIIQKYIEKPLLIYNTKFDIRQWFLVCNTLPLTIWVYKECYLRFSSQTYNLKKLHESIHLTNNSVQSKYKNCLRDVALPTYNMWDLRQFEKYLIGIGYPDMFKTIIYPGITESITNAVLLNQDNLEGRRNCFELFGADFLLTEDFHPWLLEINSRPALTPSTPVTSRMCPQVLEDVIKVVVDYARNPNANTGQFELVYKHELPKLPVTVDSSSLQITGKTLPNSYFWTPKIIEQLEFVGDLATKNDFVKEDFQSSMKTMSTDMKHALENLLKIIQKERLKHEEERALENKKSSSDFDYTNEKPTKEIFRMGDESDENYSNTSVTESSLDIIEQNVRSIENTLVKDSSNNTEVTSAEEESKILQCAIHNLEQSKIKNRNLFKNICKLLHILKQRSKVCSPFLTIDQEEDAVEVE